MPIQFTRGPELNQWEFVGPRKLSPPSRQYFGQGATSGRVNGVAFDPADSQIVYLATAGGGLWKVDQRSKTWQSLSDDWIDSKVSGVAVVLANGHRTIYAGSGDFDGGRSIYGFGLMRSTDDGLTWRNVLNNELSGYSVKHILVYPDNPDIVLLTAGNNVSELGAIWRSTDGGLTWSNVDLDYTDWDDVQCGAKDQSGKRHCYAVGAGIGGEIWRSDDAGESWTRLSPPLSWNYQQAFALATSPEDPRKVYVLAGTDRTIWASTDTGTTWKDITGDFPPGENNYNWDQSDYDISIACARGPRDKQETLYVGLIDLVASVDGGVHWSSIANAYDKDALTHSDQHSLAVNPRDPNQLLVGNDGGAYLLTLDPARGEWHFNSDLNDGLGITQFYKADFSPTNPNRMLGGAQDNATPAALGDLLRWRSIGRGDGGFVHINQRNPEIQYATSQYLAIYRTKNNWADWDPEHPEKSEITYYDETGGHQRAWLGDNPGFIAPIAPDPQNPNIMYAGTNFLWRWDEEKSQWTDHLGGQMLAAGTDDSISAIAISPSDHNRIYTGSQTGQVWMTNDGGQTWNRIDEGLPQYWVTSIVVDPAEPDAIIVALSGTGDAHSGHPGHVWKCTRASGNHRSWLNISGRFRSALPNVPVNAVVLDAQLKGRIYAGTDIGFFLSDDGGSNWIDGTRALGLPVVQVNDLRLIAGTGYLMAATFGRGIWRLKLPITVPRSRSLGGSARRKHN